MRRRRRRGKRKARRRSTSCWREHFDGSDDGDSLC